MFALFSDGSMLVSNVFIMNQIIMKRNYTGLLLMASLVFASPARVMDSTSLLKVEDPASEQAKVCGLSTDLWQVIFDFVAPGINETLQFQDTHFLLPGILVTALNSKLENCKALVALWSSSPSLYRLSIHPNILVSMVQTGLQQKNKTLCTLRDKQGLTALDWAKNKYTLEILFAIDSNIVKSAFEQKDGIVLRKFNNSWYQHIPLRERVLRALGEFAKELSMEQLRVLIEEAAANSFTEVLKMFLEVPQTRVHKLLFTKLLNVAVWRV
jgi:hypothetical protein